jgi:hypothetical protein
MFMVAWMYWYMITFYHLLTTYLNNIAVVKAAVVRIADKKLPLSRLGTGNSNNNINSGSGSYNNNHSQRFESEDTTMEVELEQANGRLSEQQKRSSLDLSVTVESPVSRQSIGIIGGKTQQQQQQLQSPQSQLSWLEAGL